MCSFYLKGVGEGGKGGREGRGRSRREEVEGEEEEGRVGALIYRMSCFTHLFDDDAFLLLIFWTSFLSLYPTFGFHMFTLLLLPRFILALAV